MIIQTYSLSSCDTCYVVCMPARCMTSWSCGQLAAVTCSSCPYGHAGVMQQQQKQQAAVLGALTLHSKCQGCQQQLLEVRHHGQQMRKTGSCRCPA
jgi:hypothetical protein